MKQAVDTLLITRRNVLNLIEGLSLEQINTIPDGFNNNLAWNLGHLVVTQQLLVYKLSKQPMLIPDAMVEQYRKGTSPSSPISQAELDTLKELLLSLPEQMLTDYNNGVFTDYIVYTTSYNITLNNTEEGIVFNNVHEGLHLGYMMALKRLV